MAILPPPKVPKKSLNYLPQNPDAPLPSPIKFVVPRPSISINEAIVENPNNDGALTDIQIALAGLRGAVEKVYQNCPHILRNEMQTEAKRHAESLQHAYSVTRPAIQASDTALRRLDGQLDALRAKTAAPPLIRDTLAAECRAALRTMKPMDRVKVIMSAAKDGDDTFASACLNGPPQLSGMSANEIAHVRRSWGSVRYPDDVSRIEKLEKARVHLDRAAELTLKYSFSVGNRALVDKAQETARKANEAIEAANASRQLLN